MAKRTFLRGWSGNFTRQVVPAERDGEVVMETTWAFVMRERDTGDEIIFAFGEDTKIEYQKQLTGFEIAQSIPGS